MIYLWRAYIEARPRVGNGFGPCELSWAEIEAWCAATLTRMAPWEKRLLREIHGAALRAAAEATPTASASGDDNDEPPAKPKRKSRVLNDRARRH